MTGSDGGDDKRDVEQIKLKEELNELKSQEEAARNMMKEAQKLLDVSQKAAILIQNELAEKFPECGSRDKLTNLSETLSSFRVSQITKLSKFTKGGNFSRFCERFKEYVHLTKMRDRDLYMLLLQNVDDQTYSTLKAVKLEVTQRGDPEIFCEIYKRAVYGDELISLKNEVLNCRQISGEDISEYVYRLREKANIAYSDQKSADENCLLAFLRGVRDTEMKVKLNESSFTGFNEAVKLSKKIERVGKMMSDTRKEGSSSVLKQTASEGSKVRDNYTYRDSNHDCRGRANSANPHQSSYQSENKPNRGRMYNGAKKSNLTCWGCGKVGHKVAECWHRTGRNVSARNFVPKHLN